MVATRHGELLRSGFLRRSVNRIVDVHVPQVVEQVLEVPKILSRDRILHGTAGQILDVPVPEMVEQLVEIAEHRIPGQNPGADCGAHR